MRAAGHSPSLTRLTSSLRCQSKYSPTKATQDVPGVRSNPQPLEPVCVLFAPLSPGLLAFAFPSSPLYCSLPPPETEVLLFSLP